MTVTELLDVKFEVFMAMALNVTDFLDVTPCTLGDGRYSVSENPSIFRVGLTLFCDWWLE
jgi:hypothetical protein